MAIHSLSKIVTAPEKKPNILGRGYKNLRELGKEKGKKYLCLLVANVVLEGTLNEGKQGFLTLYVAQPLSPVC